MTGPEAMAAGVPVVAYRAGAVAEWLQDGVSGLLVEAGDVAGLARSIEKMLLDEPMRGRMGVAAREAAGRWSLDRHVEKMLEIYVDRKSVAADNFGGCRA